MRDFPRRGLREFPRRPTAATGERTQPDEFPEPWVPIDDGHNHDGWDGNENDPDSEGADTIV
jgi:hypothetical protein